MDTFVRVSGYGPDEIEKARQEGLAEFITDAVCTNDDYGWINGVQLAKNASTPLFTNKTIPYDCILVITHEGSCGQALSDAHSILTHLEVTALSGQCQYIRSNGYYWNPNTYTRYTSVELYKVKKGAVLSAVVSSIETQIRASALYYMIHVPTEE